MTENTFKAQELCSRKLWELVKSNPLQHSINDVELNEAIRELEERHHYLTELTEIGKLDSSN